MPPVLPGAFVFFAGILAIPQTTCEASRNAGGLVPLNSSILLSKSADSGDPFSFGHRHGLTCVRVRKPVDLTAGPANLDGVGFVVVCEAERKNQFAGGEVAGAAAKHLGLRFAADGEFDGCADTVAIGFCADEFDAQAAIRSGGALGFVAEQINRATIGVEQQIQATVVIDIGVGGASAYAG